MKKITLLFNLLLLFSIGGYAQCIRTTQFPATAVVSNNLGYPQNVSNCNYTTEYAQVDGLIIGENYVFTCTLAGVHNYITVTDLSDNVITFGDSPLAVSGMPIDQVRLHYSDDVSCAGQSGCHITTVLHLLSCPIPMNSAVTNITTTSADFTWEPGGVETAWEVLILPAGSPVPTDADAGVATTALPYTDTTLMPSTDYVFYVRSNCGNEFSPWSLPLTFASLCIPNTTLPWTEDFENVATGTNIFPSCWNYINTSGAWSISTTPVANNGTHSLRRTWSTDGWAFSPITTLTAGVSYTFSYFMRTNDAIVGYDLNVAVGNGQTDADMTTELFAVTGFQDPNWNKYSYEFTPTVTGDYSFGLHVVAPNPPNGINFDDFKLAVTPTCIEPTSLEISNVTATSATVSWTASTTVPAGGYQYYISNEITAPDATTIPTGTVLADTTINLLGLNPSTMYYIWVRSACSPTDLSDWSSKKGFETLCVAVTDFTENFDAVTTPNFPDCWKRVGTGGNANTQATTGSPSGPNVMYIYSSSTTSLGVVALPAVSNAADGSHWLKFFTRANFTVGGVLEIGYLTDPTDATSFVPVSNITTTSTTNWDLQFAQFDSSIGTNQVLAFRNSGSPANSILIDDVSWEVVPSCIQPSALVADLASISENSANVSWTDSTSAPTAYDYYISTYNTAPDATTVPTGQSVAGLNFVDLFDLSPATTYYVWVRSVCSATDSSDWSAAVSFSTLCSTLGLVPTYENDFSVAAACWASNNAGDVTTGPTGTVGSGIWTADGFLNSGTTGAMKVNLYSLNRIGWMITPTLDLSSGNNDLSFDYAVSNWNGVDAIAMGSDDTVQVLLSEDDGASWSSIATFDVNAGISNSTNVFLTNLTSTSATAKIAFLATDGATDDTQDYDFFIDNFKIEAILGTGTLHTNAFNFYPNPVKNILNINTQNISNVAVFNLLGQQVATKATSNNSQIDMSALASGTYLVKVTADNQVKTIKVIKE